MSIKLIDLGSIDYQQACQIQKQILSDVISGTREDTVIICEHSHTITIGRSGSRENILIDNGALNKLGIKVYTIDRGGDITYHGPGQLVVYPILNLAHFKKDIHWYLRTLEEVAIDFLAGFGIFGQTKPGYTGVWVQDKKIASIGVAVKKWVTYHGLAININTDLGFFDYIVPCGLVGVKMTSVEELIGRRIDMAIAKSNFIETFLNYLTRQTKLTSITS